MKKLLAASLVVLGGLLAGCESYVQAPTVVEAKELAFPRDSVVFIEIVDYGHCSGVQVDRNVVLTAAHCAPDGATLRVEGQPASVLKKDESKDIAVLITEHEGPAVPLAAQAPAVDSPIVTIGFPLWVGQVATEGRVQGYMQGEFDFYMLMTSPIAGGNSGGGVFQIQQGEYVLVGIVSAVAVGGSFFPTPVPHLGLAVDLDTIKEFTALGLRQQPTQL